jgi:hypothetical protein
MTFVLLRPEIVQKILEQRLNELETQQWVGEISLYDDETKKSKPRYVFITECCLYIFTRESIRGKSSKPDVIESLFELTDATSFVEDCTVKFKNSSYHFFTPESGALCTNILTQLRRLVWNVNPVQMGINSPLFTKPTFLNIPSPKRRPANIIVLRYISCCVAKKFEIEKPVLELFVKFTADPKKVIVFDDFELKNPMAAVFAASLEGDVQGLTLDRCSPHNFGQIVN